MKNLLQSLGYDPLDLQGLVYFMGKPVLGECSMGSCDGGCSAGCKSGCEITEKIKN